MSNPFSTKQIQERYQSLPADIQQVISSSDTADLLERIGRKHKLRIDGIGVLIEYSTLIMLGLIKTDEFVSHLSKHLNISSEQAEEIAIDVDNEVFGRLRNSLREVQYQSTTNQRFAPGDEDRVQSRATSQSQEEPQTPHQTAPQAQASAQAGTQQQTVSPEQPAKEEEELPEELTPRMSSQDYNSASFTGKESQQEAANSEVAQPVQTQEKAPEVHATGFEQTSGAPPVQEQAAQQTQQATTPDQGLAQETIEKMPEAMQEVYKNRKEGGAIDQATPGPDASEEKIKDFRARLQEQLAQQDNSKVNNDPYRESID